MDINPELGFLSGDFSNPILYNILEFLDNWSCKQSNPLLVHSLDMKNTLLKRDKFRSYKIKLMNNFSAKSEFKLFNEESYKKLDTSNNLVTIIYTGNVGRFQGLDMVIKAMAKIKSFNDIQLVILGTGVAKNELSELAQRLEANVIFLPFQPANIVKKYISQCDLGLVTLRKNVYKYAYPSKTMSYLEQGIPILAVIEQESELAQDIISTGSGYVVCTEEIDELANLLISLRNDSSLKTSKREKALEFYKNNFSSEIILNKWLRLIENRS